MKCRLGPALLMTLLLVAMPATGLDRHEDFDRTDVDIAILNLYVRNALELLNKSLTSFLSDDIEGARSSSEEYSRMVLSVEGMLAEVPRNVDSYPFLSGYIDGLSRVEKNLSRLKEGFIDVVMSRSALLNISFMDWSAGPVIENLTLADESFFDAGQGIAAISSSSDDLIEDIHYLQLKDLDVQDQSDLAVKVHARFRNLSLIGISPLDIMISMMEHPMAVWEGELTALLSGSKPSGALMEVASILEGALDLLQHDLKGPIQLIVPGLHGASGSVLGYSSNQSIFLEGIVLLEYGLGRPSDLQAMASAFTACSAALSGMEQHLQGGRGAEVALLPFTDRSIAEKLDLLGDQIRTYKERLERIDILRWRLEEVTEAVNRTLWANVIGADIDGSGDISIEEAASLELGGEALELSSEASALLESLLSGLRSLPVWLLSKVGTSGQAIQGFVEQACLLTLSHYGLIENITLMTSGTRSDPFLEAYLGSLDHLTRMSVSLDALSSYRASLAENGIRASDGPLGPLRDLAGMYWDLLEELGYILNSSAVILRITPSTAPFDSTVHFAVMVIERTIEGKVAFKEGQPVDIFLDGEPLSRETTRRGLAQGKFQVGRGMGLGVHSISSRVEDLPEGALWANGTFDVRRIRTEVVLSPGTDELRPGESTEVLCSVLDEFGRGVQGRVRLGGGGPHVENGTSVPVSFDRPGKWLITGSYEGDSIFASSDSSVLFNVSHDPIIVLSAGNTWTAPNKTLTLEVLVELGCGDVVLHIDGLMIELGRMENGSLRSSMVNASLLGLGYHLARAYLETRVPWARSGWSITIGLMISVPNGSDGGEPPGPPVNPPDENASWGNDDDDLIEWWPPSIFKGQWFWWTAAGVLVSLLLISLSLSFLINRRKLRRGLGPANPEPQRGPTGMAALQSNVGTPIIREKADALRGWNGMEVDGNGLAARETIIRQYVEMVDSAPDRSGIGRSQTPREVKGRLDVLGFEEKVSSRMTASFEESIYRRGFPEKGTVGAFRDDSSRAGRFLESLDLDRRDGKKEGTKG